MAGSILNDVKKILGIQPDYTHFDLDITLHINSVLSTLTQLGVGPQAGFMVEDASATWDAIIGTDNQLNSVKSYVCLRVKMLFDPPQTSYLIAALQEQVKELEWRMNVYREGTQWVDPNNFIIRTQVLDGGSP